MVGITVTSWCEMWRILQISWTVIPQAKFQKLCQSMCKRIHTVISERPGATQYRYQELRAILQLVNVPLHSNSTFAIFLTDLLGIFKH